MEKSVLLSVKKNIPKPMGLFHTGEGKFCSGKIFPNLFTWENYCPVELGEE